MASEDFDIHSLASHLQLTRDQVTRLAERGQLPGRRIAGQWRFARAEVHHWWECRIGQSCEAELIECETVLRREDSDLPAEFTLAGMLPLTAIAIPLPAKTRNSTIRAMVDLAERSGFLWDVGKMEEAVRAREDLHPTALDNGVALLHPRRPLSGILAEPFLAVGRTSGGIPFGGRVLTDIFILICSTDERGHLRTLARLSRLLADAGFLRQLREVAKPREVLELFADAEARLLSGT